MGGGTPPPAPGVAVSAAAGSPTKPRPATRWGIRGAARFSTSNDSAARGDPAVAASSASARETHVTAALGDARNPPPCALAARHSRSASARARHKPEVTAAARAAPAAAAPGAKPLSECSSAPAAAAAAPASASATLTSLCADAHAGGSLRAIATASFRSRACAAVAKLGSTAQDFSTTTFSSSLFVDSFVASLDKVKTSSSSQSPALRHATGAAHAASRCLSFFARFRMARCLSRTVATLRSSASPASTRVGREGDSITPGVKAPSIPPAAHLTRDGLAGHPVGVAIPSFSFSARPGVEDPTARSLTRFRYSTRRASAASIRFRVSSLRRSFSSFNNRERFSRTSRFSTDSVVRFSITAASRACASSAMHALLCSFSRTLCSRNKRLRVSSENLRSSAALAASPKASAAFNRVSTKLALRFSASASFFVIVSCLFAISTLVVLEIVSTLRVSRDAFFTTSSMRASLVSSARFCRSTSAAAL